MTPTSPSFRAGPRVPTSGLAWWCLVVLVAATTARLTMVSVQLGCTAALVVLTVGIYLRNRTAGLVTVWLIWLIAPFVRRVFFLSDPIVTADPLALAPFLVTAAVIAFELRAVELSRRSKRLLGLIGAGYAIGIPVGLLVSPTSAAFALFAYLTAAGCFVIGYRDGEGGGRLALPTVLLVATPVLALYAFQQYYLPLPVWDDVWFETADINSAGSPDGSRVRPWSTLNSPGTFALVLGAAAVAFVSLDRLNPVRLAGIMAVLAALALTYVRSVWLAVAFAIVAVALVTRGAAIRRLGAVGIVAVLLAPVAFGGATGAALGDRATSFGTLGTDESAQERLDTPLRILPAALSLPLGRGVGQAGEATRLTGMGFRYTDNGYLSLMFQVGPAGFLLVMAALVMAARSAWRNAWLRPRGPDLLAFGMLAFMIVAMLAGDQLYGVAGMIVWYVAGLAVRRGEAGEGQPIT